MVDKRRIGLVVLMGVVLLTLAGGSALLLLKLAKVRNPLDVKNSWNGKPYVIPELSFVSGDVIRKAVHNDGVARYELIGEFTSPIEINSNNIMKATFQLKSYPKDLSTLVRVGARGGTVQIGAYKGSFDGNVVWKMGSTLDIVSEVEDRPVLLRIDIPLDSARDDFEYFLSIEQSLDNLILTRRSGDSNQIMPDLSLISFPSIAWVEEE